MLDTEAFLEYTWLYCLGIAIQKRVSAQVLNSEAKNCKDKYKIKLDTELYDPVCGSQTEYDQI